MLMVKCQKLNIISMFAVIETGGKQYKVSPGQKIRVEKIEAEPGAVLDLDKVLLTSDGGEDVKIGAPYVEGAKAEIRVIKQDKEKTKIVFKYHSKTRRKTKKGHRQPFTEIEIVGIK